MTAWKKVEQGTGCQAPVPCENNKTISDNYQHQPLSPPTTSEAQASCLAKLFHGRIVMMRHVQHTCHPPPLFTGLFFYYLFRFPSEFKLFRFNLNLN